MAARIEYTDAKAMMKHGAEALHEHLSERIETAMGKALPQMEVRYKNLSIAVDFTVTSDDYTQELPTLVNALKKMVPGSSKKKHIVTKTILHHMDGVFKPGSMTLVLGQPGSGKSSLMKILSGRFPMAKNVKVEGEITYNGASREEIRSRLPQFVSYVTQRDNHFPTLSVKETLEYAHEFCGGEMSEREEKRFNQGTPEENQAALEAARALYKHYPDVIIQQLGLENCQDTVVGNAMLRGVSGGERKRVTTGEMAFGNKYVTLMDEISTGLDSAATYDIIKTQRSIAKKLRKTVVIALLQPSPEVFGLFDDVMILSKGRVMYHGPCDQVVNYFQELGFHCPPNRDVADYLMDLGTKQQHQYEVARSDGSNHPRKAREFAEIYVKSTVHNQMLMEVHGPHDPVLLKDKEEHFDQIPEFHQSYFASVMTLTRRQLKLTLRNPAMIQGRAIMSIFTSLLYGSVFWQLDPKNIQVIVGLLYQSVMFLILGQSSQIPIIMAEREVFYKQRGANFFRTSSYVLASSLSQIPVAILEAALFGSILYWMCGLVSSAAAFLVFEALLFVASMVFGTCFFFVSALSPDANIAKAFSMIALLFFLLVSGFLITRSQIPDYFIWVYWMNPMTWCLQTLAINQYRRPEFDVCEYDGIDYCAKYGKQMGAYSLSLFDIESDKSWLGLGFVFLIGAYIVLMTLTTLALEYKRYESPENVGLEKEEVNEKFELVSTTSDASSTYGLMETPRGDSSSNVILEVRAATHERYFEPVTLAFKDLWYSVPDPKDPKGVPLNLLKGVSGFASPGTITALMGSSGAGKTTLMDVIAGRKTGGSIKGQILLNGHPASDLAIRRATGYCEQMDIHSEASTIREALTFSAFLRQGSDVPDSQKFDSVEEVLDLLDLRPIADQIIRGSSVEQMKRLTIGVELAAQPSVLFLDEPTSGLDARSAKVIMDGVRKVADTGRTVVCTIHQPSWEVFSVFDSLLLLKRGGQTVFFGELGTKAVELKNYFESVPGVAPLEEGYNPATWMLEVIGAGVGNSANGETDFVAVFESSEKKALLLDENLARPGVSSPVPGASALEFKSKRAATEWTQARFLIGRFMDLYWRSPSYNLTRYLINIFAALIYGLLYLNVDYETYQGINSGEALVYMATLGIGVVAFDTTLPVSVAERAPFYRERASQTYNALWYFVGGTLAEIPYILTSSLVFVGIFYPMVGFTGVSRFFLYWFNTAVYILMETYLGQLLAFSMPSEEAATLAGVMVKSTVFLFMGFNPPSSAIPSGYKWLYHINPHKYSLAAVSATIFGDCPEEGDLSELACRPIKNLPATVSANLTIKGYIEEVFVMKHDEIWTNVSAVIGFIVLFRILALLALRFINHQKK